MPRLRWFAPVLLIPLLVASPAAAQTSPTIAVDDDTPTVGLAVNVTVTCPEPVGFVDGTIRRDPPDPIAAMPPSFASQTLPFTFPVTFNVDGNFTITAECTDSSGRNSSASLNLTVTAEQTTTTTAPTTTIAPTTTVVLPTTGPVEPTTAAVSPTSAASATTDPGQLPATGTSDSTALIAVILLGLGAMVLLVARKFRALDE